VARLQREIEAVLGVRVEVVPASDLKPGVRDEVEADAVAL
jgi:predicted nucleotidyltransferase